MNMDYCKFENTLQDLMQCYQDMDNLNISKEELRYRQKLIDLCIEIAECYGENDYE